VAHLLDEISNLYQRDVVRRGKAREFWMLVSFLVTFLITRAATISVRHSEARVRGVRIRDIHVHHLVWGILLMLACGYLAAARSMSTLPVVILFGVGAALTLDEFALWLHLEDVYWTERGRHSVRIVIIVASLAALGFVGLDFWRHFFHAVVTDIT
jgi:hypothetical protein